MATGAAFAIRLLDPSEARVFAHLTFPAYRDLLIQQVHRTVAAGFLAGDDPAGLALAVMSAEERPRAKLLSVMVAEPFRRRGAARSLLGMLEQELASRGCLIATGRVTGSDDKSLPVERLLDSSGWDLSGPSSILCHARKTIIEAPWLANGTLREGMEVFPWLELGSSERAAMLERQARERWIPENLNPFWNEPLHCSLQRWFAIPRSRAGVVHRLQARP